MLNAAEIVNMIRNTPISYPTRGLQLQRTHLLLVMMAAAVTLQAMPDGLASDGTRWIGTGLGTWTFDGAGGPLDGGSWPAIGSATGVYENDGPGWVHASQRSFLYVDAIGMLQCDDSSGTFLIWMTIEIIGADSCSPIWDDAVVQTVTVGTSEMPLFVQALDTEATSGTGEAYLYVTLNGPGFVMARAQVPPP